MTTLLPAPDIATLRALARTAAVLLVMLRVDQVYPGRAVADFEICDILEVDKRTVQKQLRSLSAAGLVMEQRESRYVVTSDGRNTLFGWSDRQASNFSIEEGKNTDENEIPRAHCVPHELIEEEDIVVLTLNDSSSASERTFCAQTTAQILQATNLLFGSSVSVNEDILSRDPKHALCWVAKAYADRATRDNPKGLSNPQGLIYQRLARRVTPPVYLLHEPTQGLPNEYLAAIGLTTSEPKRDVTGFCGLHMMPNPCPICVDIVAMETEE